MDGTVLVHLLLILLVGFRSWNNITEAASASKNTTRLKEGFLSWNNITEAESASKNTTRLKEKASKQDMITEATSASHDTKLWKQEAQKQRIFPMCENVKKMCMAGVPDCLRFSLLDQRLIGKLSESGQLLESDQQQRVVCCLECKKDQRKLIPILDPCKPFNPCGSRGKCLFFAINFQKWHECICHEDWKGENCDIPNFSKYHKRKKFNCSTYSCKTPNECVHKDNLKDKIKSALERGGNHEHYVVKDTNKLEQLTKVIQKTSSRGSGTICFCSPGKRGLWCDFPCKAGTWGIYCFEKCDENCRKPECSSKDGECECKRGYISKNGVCESLPATKDNCLTYCNPKHGHCDRNNNCVCNYAQGFYCDTKCSKVKPYPRYGEKCEHACGGCTRLPCDKESGVCPQPKNSKERCLDFGKNPTTGERLNFFGGKLCHITRGVRLEGTVNLIKLDDLVPDDQFVAALARIENNQKKMKLIKEKILRRLHIIIPGALASTSVGMFIAGGVASAVGAAAAATGIAFAGAIVGLAAVGVVIILVNAGAYPSWKLLQHKEPGLRIDISLPLPPGDNASTYKNVMQKILENVADGFQTDLIPGLGAKKESIRVTSVQPFDNSYIENSSTDSLPLVIGGVVVAIIAVVVALIALTSMKRKPSKNKPWAPVRQNNRKPSKNRPWGAPVRQNNLTFTSQASGYTGPTATQLTAVSQQQFRQQIGKTSCTRA